MKIVALLPKKRGCSRDVPTIGELCTFGIAVLIRNGINIILWLRFMMIVVNLWFHYRVFHCRFLAE